MDLTELIDSVMNKPPLWDRNDPAYNNKDVKYMLWKDVCRELQWGIGDLEMKAKWTSLRDTFRRELKRKQVGCKKKTKWAYYDQMMFLKPSIIFDRKGKNTSRARKVIVPTHLLQTAEDKLPRSDLVIRSEENSPAEESNEVEMTQPNESEIDTPHNSVERESINKENAFDEADYYFAMSLVPAMKRVPNDRKLRMRVKILQILNEEGGANDSSV